MTNREKDQSRPEASADEASTLTRRGFLNRSLALGAFGVAGSTLLGACGGGEGGEGGSGSASGGEGSVTASECGGYDQLTESELEMRETLGYVDESPQPDKLCTNCQFLEESYEGAPADTPCVGCQLFAGPVAPEGYCISWAAAT